MAARAAAVGAAAVVSSNTKTSTISSMPAAWPSVRLDRRVRFLDQRRIVLRHLVHLAHRDRHFLDRRGLVWLAPEMASISWLFWRMPSSIASSLRSASPTSRALSVTRWRSVDEVLISRDARRPTAPAAAPRSRPRRSPCRPPRPAPPRPKHSTPAGSSEGDVVDHADDAGNAARGSEMRSIASVARFMTSPPSSAATETSRAFSVASRRAAHCRPRSRPAAPWRRRSLRWSPPVSSCGRSGR